MSALIGAINIGQTFLSISIYLHILEWNLVPKTRFFFFKMMNTLLGIFLALAFYLQH